LVPVVASAADIEGVFNTYISRVDSKVSRSMEPIEALIEALEDGPEAPEWFWLVRRPEDGVMRAAPTPETADGLCVFRLKRLSTAVGQLLHLSVTDLSWAEDALDAVKTRMFAWQPISSIRATLWYCDFDGEFQLYKDYEACFKKQRFRWFQLTNSKGVRGQVMNSKRFPPDPPDFAGDPALPPEEFAVEVCVGQAWLVGGHANVPGAGCPSSSLVVAAACLRQLWSQAAGAAAADGASEGVAADVAARRRAEAGAGSAPEGSPGHLAGALARTLEAGPSGRAIPGVALEAASEEHAELVRRGITAQGFAEAIAGLEAEALVDDVTAMAPKEAVLGRLFVTLDWLSVRPRASGGFEVPVHMAGQCSGHFHPVFYVATTDDDIFVVIIPFEGFPTVPEAEVFSKCTDMLRNIAPMESPPFKTLAFESAFDVRHWPRTFELEDSAALGADAPGGGPVHVAEVSSLSVGPGRPIPGRLASADTGGKAAGAFGAPVFVVRRPFALCVFHTGIDDLNVPLTASFVT